MQSLFVLAVSPILICAFYVFIRDKYEKEPLRLLFLGLIFGALITTPIVLTEKLITFYIPNGGVLMEAFFLSFAVAALVEEGFKYVVLFFLIWKDNNFNERFDGIVYSVFISLGFAGVENVMYVYNPTMGGFETAISRAIISVPAHGFFGILMGYYFALSKYEPEKRTRHIIGAFIVPFLVHGIYDFILLSNLPYLMFIFIPFLIYIWISGFRKMKTHIEASPFKGRKRRTSH